MKEKTNFLGAKEKWESSPLLITQTTIKWKGAIMLMILVNEDKHTEETPDMCEIILPDNVISDVRMSTIASIGKMLSLEIQYYHNADDKTAMYFKRPMCCGAIHGCIWSISEFSIIDYGGVTIEKDGQLAEE